MKSGCNTFSIVLVSSSSWVKVLQRNPFREWWMISYRAEEICYWTTDNMESTSTGGHPLNPYDAESTTPGVQNIVLAGTDGLNAVSLTGTSTAAGGTATKLNTPGYFQASRRFHGYLAGADIYVRSGSNVLHVSESWCDCPDKE